MNINTQAVEAGTSTMQTKVAYTASATGVLFAGLTITEVVGIVVGVGSLIFAGLTWWSNHKKNQAIIRALEEKRLSGEEAQ